MLHAKNSTQLVIAGHSAEHVDLVDDCVCLGKEYANIFRQTMQLRTGKPWNDFAIVSVVAEHRLPFTLWTQDDWLLVGGEHGHPVRLNEQTEVSFYPASQANLNDSGLQMDIEQQVPMPWRWADYAGVDPSDRGALVFRNLHQSEALSVWWLHDKVAISTIAVV